MRLPDSGPAGEDHPWTAIVLAGERPGGDPLARALGVPAKALLEVGGRSMLCWVVEALLASSSIGKVLVLAQDIETLARAERSNVLTNPRVSLVRSGDGIASSIEAIAGGASAPWPLLVTTADNPLLTSHRVDRFIHQAHGADVAVGVGERATVERRFPHTRRTWLKFSDGHFSGANLFALVNEHCLPGVRHWQAVEQDRKNGFRLIASFGPLLLLRALTRTIGLEDGMAQGFGRLGFTAKPIVLDAEAPIDVDKPEDIELVERILAARKAGYTDSPESIKPLSDRAVGTAMSTSVR